jgi:hypothetical protein
MSRFVFAVTLLAIGNAPANAQPSRVWDDLETTVSYGPRWSHGSRRDPANATPVAIRLTYLRNESRWGAEIGADFGGLRQSAEGRLKEIVASVGVTARLSPRPKEQGTSGFYALASLTQTLLAPTSDARVAKLYGYTLGISQRVALGRSGILRADITYSRDRGEHFEGRLYPGSEGVAIRLGLGLRNNF